MSNIQQYCNQTYKGYAEFQSEDMFKTWLNHWWLLKKVFISVNLYICKLGIWEIIYQIKLTLYDKIVWQWPAHSLVRLGKVLWLDFCGHGLRFYHQSIEKQTKSCPCYIFFNDFLNQIILKLFSRLLNKNNTLDEYQIYVYKKIHIFITGIYQKNGQNDRLKFIFCLFFGTINLMIMH